MQHAEQLAILVAQVHRAHRRMMFQKFIGALVWYLFTTLLVAASAILVTRIWAIGVDTTLWWTSWVGGSVGAGVLLAIIWTYARRSTMMQAAIEIDQRFALKERVSSSLWLDETELQREAGQELLRDASRRVAKLDVLSRFPLQTGWRALLPLIPTAAVFAMVLLTSAVHEQPAGATETPIAIEQQIRRSTKNLKKKIVERKQQAEERGLKDAAGFYNQLEKGLDRMFDASDVDRRKALSELNDLGNELKKRRQMLGGSDRVKRQLNQLKNLKQGPAGKFANAMKEGDFQKALDELDKLRDEIEQGDLTLGEQEDLAGQLNQMADKLQQLVDAHQMAKDELERQIEQSEKRGDRQQAGKLQQQFDRLNQLNQHMDKLQRMAQSLGDCSQCMPQGQNQGGDPRSLRDALSRLDQLSDDLSQLQQDLDQMRMLDDALDQIAQAKNAMNCDQCGGGGCKQCRGAGMGRGQQQGPPGAGMGEGQGKGGRSEEKNATNFFESRVRGDPDGGKAVIVGEVRGPNVGGQAREQIKSDIHASKSEDADPLTGVRLPKAQREHAREYFDSFREGE